MYENKLGTLPGTLHLNVDEKVRPQIMQNRRTPVLIEDIKQFTEMYENKLGTLPGTLHLNVDEKVRPQIMQNRRTPVLIEDKVSTELKRLVKMKFITKVEETTAWLSQIKCVEKKNVK